MLLVEKASTTQNIELTAIAAGHTITNVLVDTGATANFVNQHTVDLLHLELNQLPAPRTITIANGDTAPIFSEVSFKIQFEALPLASFECRAYVITSMHNPITLGVEFLSKYNATINFGQQTLTIGPYTMEIQSNTSNVSLDLD